MHILPTKLVSSARKPFILSKCTKSICICTYYVFKVLLNESFNKVTYDQFKNRVQIGSYNIHMFKLFETRRVAWSSCSVSRRRLELMCRDIESRLGIPRMLSTTTMKGLIPCMHSLPQ
jgi:hypothetical protein